LSRSVISSPAEKYLKKKIALAAGWRMDGRRKE
jgi:hypothetical protein